MSGGLSFVQVKAGNQFTCGVATSGRAYCWGYNLYGQLGNGTTENRLAPIPVAGDHTFRQLNAGSSHVCGTTPEAVAYCWGYNGYGELGDGTLESRTAPVRVGGGG